MFTSTETYAQPVELTILHNNDAESQLINAGSGLGDFGGVARFKTLVDSLKARAAANGRKVLMLSSGDNFLAGPEFNASLQLPEVDRYYDAIAVDLIGYDALAIGNHEFDFGPDVLEDFISDVSTTAPPFLSANLDFSSEAGLQALVNSGRIASRIIVEVNGDSVGIIGATTPNLPFISSPRDVIVNSDVAGIVQSEVDALTADGVDNQPFAKHHRRFNLSHPTQWRRHYDRRWRR
jgi:5'-nucleotidase